MISHPHRTIFFHIPKCAGQSVESAFLADLGLSWETRAPLLLRANDRPELGPPRLAHLRARDYAGLHYVSRQLFDEYFKFAVVRNPWSRAVSLYHHMGLNLSFATFVEDWLPAQLCREGGGAYRWFVMPQVEFLMEEDALLTDATVRLEELPEAFEPIAARAGLESPLPHRNRTGEVRGPRRLGLEDLAATWRVLRAVPLRARPAFLWRRLGSWAHERHATWRDYYDPGLVEAVGHLYRDDVTTFGYAFDA